MDFSELKIPTPFAKAAGINAYDGKTVSDILDKLMRFWPYDVAIFLEGSQYVAQSRKGKQIDAQSTLPPVFTSATGALTAGRIHPERILMLGALISNGMLIQPDYSEIGLICRLTQAASSNLSALFRNAGYGTAQSRNMRIIGPGIIDLNKANSAQGHGILWDGVLDAQIEGPTVLNAGGPAGRGIYITTTIAARVSENVTIKGVKIDGCNDSNIELSGTAGGEDATTVRRCKVLDLTSTNAGHRNISLTNARYCILSQLTLWWAVTHNIDLSYNSTDNIISDLTGYHATLNGINVDTLTSARNQWYNPHIAYAGSIGIGTSAPDNIFIGGLAEYCNQNGLRFAAGSDRCKAIGMTCKNNSQNPVNSYGGAEIRDTVDCKLVALDCYDDQGTKTQKYGVALNAATSGCLVALCDVRGNVEAVGLLNSGANNIIRDNPGHNPQGTASITVTASPFAYTAGASPEAVYIRNGTGSVSDVSKNSRTIFAAAPCTVFLEPNEAAVVTYAGGTIIMEKDRK